MQCYSYRFCKQNFLYSVIREIQPIKIHRACTLQPKSIFFSQGFKRTTKGFDCKTQCTGRTYMYVLPTYALAPVEMVRLHCLKSIKHSKYITLTCILTFHLFRDLTQNCFLMGMNYLVHVQMYFKCQIFLKFRIENES